MLVPEPTDHFTVTVDLVADLAVINPFDFFLEASAEQYPFAYDAQLALELAPYLVPEPCGPAFEAYLATIDRSERATTSFVFDLNARLQHEIGVPHSHGARRANARRNARESVGLVSRLRVAAGAMCCAGSDSPRVSHRAI